MAIEAVNTQRQEENRDNLPQIRFHKLKLLCEMRWVERHTTLDDFIILYEALLDCLGSINATSGSWSSKCVTEASGLPALLSSSSFIIACTCVSYLFGFTKMMTTKPYSNWKDTKSDFKAHSPRVPPKCYGINDIIQIDHAKSSHSNVSDTLSENSKQQVQRNRTMLKSIIKAVEICGRQEWALRGRRDDATSDDMRKGNFYALLAIIN